MNPHAQSAVTEALHQAIATLGETGLQVAAIHQGEVVVDTFAGIADPATGRPVDANTLFTVWSMSKGVTATVVHGWWNGASWPTMNPWPGGGRHSGRTARGTSRCAMRSRTGLA